MGLVSWIRRRFESCAAVRPRELHLPPPTPPFLPAAQRLSPLPRTALSQRCLELTAFFETSMAPPACYGRVAGDFDGQGLSAGCLQWNLGQGTLQPLLHALLAAAEDDVREALGADRLDDLRRMLALATRAEQVGWARGRQDGRRVAPRWREAFRRLGELPAFQDLQVEAAGRRFRWAVDKAVGWETPSERAVALFFDIRVQNGSIPRVVAHQVRERLAAPPDPIPEPDLETWKLATIANLRAEAAHPRWVEDVRRRKLAIARGAGEVHGQLVDLEADYDITMRAVPEVVLRMAKARERVLA